MSSKESGSESKEEAEATKVITSNNEDDPPTSREEKDASALAGDKNVKDTATTATDNNEKGETKSRWKRALGWLYSSIKVPSLSSLPVLKILQGIWLSIMIYKSLSGSTSSLFPFGDNSPAPAQVHPFIAELRSSDMYGDEQQFPDQDKAGSENGLFQLLFGSTPENPVLPLNTGIPKDQHIVVSHLNREYESFRYSVSAATNSKLSASHDFANVSLRRSLEKAVSLIVDQRSKQALTILEENYMKKANRLLETQTLLRAKLVDTKYFYFDNHEQCTNDTGATRIVPSFTIPDQQCVNETNSSITDSYSLMHLPNDDQNLTTKEGTALDRNATLEMIKSTGQELKDLTDDFVDQLAESLPGAGHAIKDALVGHSSLRGAASIVHALNTFPLRTMTRNLNEHKKRLFVVYFTGDIFASEVDSLRKEVTAILRSSVSTVTDQVLVVLQSSGGTVTGYGLAAAQLLRIKDAGLHLTVAVEQVAASGGYLAACVASTVVCSAFSAVGSIGVVQEFPNFHRRLKVEGIDYYTVTAGEYKRTLSATKDVTEEDLKKAQDDLDEVHMLFKHFVKEHRPHIDLDVVATGEVWYGNRAVEVGLCDSIQSADDVLMDYVDRGFDVYHVKHYVPITGLLETLFGDLSDISTAAKGDFAKTFVQWISQKLLPVLKLAATGNNPILMT